MERAKMTTNPIEIFSTCPQSKVERQDCYLRRVIEVAQWSERCGCKGILVYSDNSQLDPWLVSQVIIANTERLCPLVAVQPFYMHPYSTAKMAASLGYLYGRRTYLNMVAGGFKGDLEALNDGTAHDQRYSRLVEYTQIVKALLRGPEPVTCRGNFFAVDKLRMSPPLPPELFPGIFVSGSSPAGVAAAKEIGATAIEYPKPAEEAVMRCRAEQLDSGIRVGIIARDDAEDAWRVAFERFPEDRKGQLTHQLAMKVSDSFWHSELSNLEEWDGNSPYWLRPFETYKSFCPYLVGSYDRVAEELATYQSAGYQTFILDIPASEEELQHVRIVFDRAQERNSMGSCEVERSPV
jgi:alkanesulfonate monooxygenase